MILISIRCEKLLLPCQIPDFNRQAEDRVVNSEQLPSQVRHVRIGGKCAKVHHRVAQHKNAVQVRETAQEKKYSL
jgi:hypothetical protein